MKMNKEDLDNLSRQRVSEMRQALADSINKLELNIEMFKFVCEQNEWNDDVVYQIEEGALKLGMALATLVNWYKDEEEAEKEGKEEGK